MAGKSKEISALSPTSPDILGEGDNEVGEEAQTATLPAKSGDRLPTKRGRGRPPGAKNKDTLFKELMTTEFQDIARKDVPKVIKVLFERAQAGDMKAIKLVMDRIAPVSKAVDLSDMEKKGLTINISVGNMEEEVIEASVVEEGDFTEVDDEG